MIINTSGFKIILLGAPGSGKGTQSKKISSYFKLEKFVLGDLIREQVDSKSNIGVLCKSYMDLGKLVPDNIITQLVDFYLTPLFRLNKGVVLDGFPRNLFQAQYLRDISICSSLSFFNVFFLDLSLDRVEERLLNRLICTNCKSTFSLKINKPKIKNKCDYCHSRLEVRSDDNDNIIRNRYSVYLDTIMPILDFYSKILVKIDANQSEDMVFFQIKTSLLKTLHVKKKLLD